MTSHGVNEPEKSSEVQDQPRGRSQGHSGPDHRARSRSRSRRRSRSRHRSRSRRRSHSRSRRSRSRSPHRSRSRSHRRSRSPPHSHHLSDSRSNPPAQSPPRYTAQQKGKQGPRAQLPSTPHAKAVAGHAHYRDRPGPSSLARPRAARESSPETTDEDQSEGASEKVQSKDEASFWRHVGKSYALRHESWLSRSSLRCACRCESPDDADNQMIRHIIEYLDWSVIKPDVRTTKAFQSEVCSHLNHSSL